jgi:hypothetical protein
LKLARLQPTRADTKVLSARDVDPKYGPLYPRRQVFKDTAMSNGTGFLFPT